MATCLVDWRSIQDDREKYAAYLCSREWAEKREAVRERAYGKCERCGILPMDACHHLTYERKYDESLDDLQAICNRCHRFVHGKDPSDPTQETWPLTVMRDELLCPTCEDDARVLFVTCYPRGTRISLECANGHKFYLLMATIKGSTQIGVTRTA